VIAYLEAENAYTEAVMAPSKDFQETLYQELIGRIQRTDTDVPFRMGDFYYYFRTEEGKDYGILCRKRGSLDAPEEILLDLNEIAGEYLELGSFAPSYDQRYLAYTLNETGGLEFILYVKDLETGEILPDQLPSDGYNFAWAADNRTLFYTQQDDTLRSFEAYRHELGTDFTDDPLLYREDDPVFDLYVSVANSREFVFLLSSSYESSEVRYLPMSQPAGEFTLFAPRRDGIQYYLDHHPKGDEFLVLTDDGAVNFRLAAVPVADPAWANLRDLIPGRENRLLESLTVFADYFLVSGREGGLTALWIYDVASGDLRPMTFEEPVRTVWQEYNPEFDSTQAIIGYTSFVTPSTWYEVDLVTGERTLIKQNEVLGGHDPSLYVSEVLYATAPDGVQVPISLVRRRDAGDGPRPLRLDGYGAYGISSDPVFGTNRLSLIDRGITYAIAHVRGGQELGRPWYEDGKLLHKKNTFTDFIACAEHLVATEHTAPDRLLAYGASAGGLLMGAVANERPDLFHLIIADVPFVDVLRVMLDPSLPLTTAEYVEWGDPRDPLYYDYIASYSPYDNVAHQAYPNLYITGSIEDDQVPYWQPAKWTAKLRAMKTDDNTILLKTNLGAGHSGESAYYDAQRDIAFTYTVVLAALGMTGTAPLATPAGVATPVAAIRPARRGTA
jgi:oligopeptidase B